MLGGEWKLGPKPELVVLSDGVGLVIQNAEIPVCCALSHKDPHTLDSHTLVGVINADTEDELGKVTSFKAFSPMLLRYPEGVGASAW